MHKKEKKTRSKTPTFLLELPLSVDSGQARRLRSHFEAARCLYNALLGEATSRLRRMRADPRWQEARTIPRAHKQERSVAFALLRHTHGFSAYALHAFAKEANCVWIADHLDAVTAQTLATHRKSLHGRLVNEIVCVGNDLRIEKISYQGWQKQFGKSVGLRAPGMLIDHLRRTVANTGGTLHEVPTRTTKLSQYCHGCHTYTKKPLSQRWHLCACGVGPVQRDLYSAFLAAYLDPANTIPSIAHDEWEGAEARLRAAMERLQQRAKEGQVLPRSVGIPRAGARLPQSFAQSQQELVYRNGRREALVMKQEPLVLEPGESQ